MSSTPSFVEAITRVLDNKLRNTFNALPAKIETYDETKQLASVKPLLNRKLKDESELILPVINNVPVIFPRTANAIISLPIAVGDKVLLVFADRSLDEWLSSGNEVFPADNRMHDLSDAIALPGLYDFSSASDASKDDLLIKHKTSKITIAANGDIKIDGGASGKIAIGNSSEELISLMEEFITGLTAMTTATSIGPQPPINLATFTDLLTRIATIKGSL